MSRSIGDTIGSEVGVISTPICTFYDLRGNSDSFVVIASDGVWDVMENDDVVQFVEFYRNKCLKCVDLPALETECIVPNNSTIAQLLCEEARMRWFAIVEEEDIMIDDISCIVLELENTVNSAFKKNSCKPNMNLEIPYESVDQEVTVFHKVPSQEETKTSFNR